MTHFHGSSVLQRPRVLEVEATQVLELPTSNEYGFWSRTLDWSPKTRRPSPALATFLRLIAVRVTGPHTRRSWAQRKFSSSGRKRATTPAAPMPNRPG